jgi:hypothetical protein
MSGGVKRLQRSGGGPIFPVPIQPTGRTGSGDLESVAGYFAVAHASADREIARARSSVTPLEFERLSHVAANIHSLSVRAGNVIRFCSPNEQ